MTVKNPIPRHGRFQDLTGKVFGRLTVLSFAGMSKWHTSMWLCRCECGSEKSILANALKTGNTRSCGCLQPDVVRENGTTHGQTGTLTFSTWRSMINRCYTPGTNSYERYGGTGITVCRRWRDDFFAFLADMGERPSKKYTIDRYPNQAGNYEPGNCRWATCTENNRNRSTSRYIECWGQRLHLHEWSEKTGIPHPTIWSRIHNFGWSPERALTTPARAKQPNGAGRKKP